jgi:hypothetical protein
MPQRPNATGAVVAAAADDFSDELMRSTRLRNNDFISIG